MNKTHYVLGCFILISFIFAYFNDKLTKENEILKAKLDTANINLELQNERIKALSVEIKPQEIKEVERIKKIYIKDNTCESQLKAYKELFNEIN